MTSTVKFSDFKLAQPLARALTDAGYETPTPIQAQSIPLVMQGHDLLGVAQTGTGKTASFALPTLHHIFTEERETPKRSCRTLVLAPTRELAAQIAESFKTYGAHMDLSVEVIFGGVSIQRQIKRVVAGNDVVVATPGRLLDLIERKVLKLSEVEVLILDEADQMMDMGFIHSLRKIAALVPRERQTLFFSATMPPKIKTLAGQFLTNPKKVAVAPESTTAERVTQSVIMINQAEKQALLTLTLSDPSIDRALVFTRTKHGADRVVKRLWRAGIDSVAIHGNKSQGQRKRALDAFKDGKVKVMIATDVAARGIDIDGISHVINFELPNVAEQYVHRIGRTARAGREGRAIAFCASDEKAYLKDIEKQIKQRVNVEALPENFNAEVNRIKSLPPANTKPPSAAGVQSETPAKRKGRGKSRRNKRRENDPNQRNSDAPKKVKSGEDRTDSKPSRAARKRGRNDEQGFRKRKPKPEGSEGGEARPAREPRPYIKAGETAKPSETKSDGPEGDFKFKRKARGGEKPKGKSGAPKPSGGRDPNRRGKGSRPRNAGKPSGKPRGKPRS